MDEDGLSAAAGVVSRIYALMKEDFTLSNAVCDGTISDKVAILMALNRFSVFDKPW